MDFIGALTPVFCPAFSKAGEMFPTGNAIERLCRLRMLAKQAAHTLCVYR